ncbi:hypothetical protein [Hydrogenophaga sp.]|uniref:hypothetical protein n=1 Tax=Hydrogenophaga sp. TaxID=1904254 RepID=UPI003566DE9F
MMSLVFNDGHFAWAFVSVVVYLTALLLLCDYVWRSSRLGGKTVFLSTAVLGLFGSALILLLA